MSVLRFKCQQDELSNSLQNFSVLHKFDNNHTLKLHFKDWLIHNKRLIDIEREYLQRYHYATDIETKLYKSIKYYYIKKDREVKIKPQIERNYTIIPKDLMFQIKEDIHNQFKLNIKFKPSHTFETFKQDKDYDEIKLKKAYKNQYYQLKLNL